MAEPIDATARYWHREDLARIQKSSICSECGGFLAMRARQEEGTYWWLECARNATHQGFFKPPSLFNRPLTADEIAARGQ